MSLHVLANQMAAKGRKGDSMLVHMTPGEVYGLQALAVKHGGTLTINPDTGLPEANFLKKLLPTLIGAGLSFIPGVGPLLAAGIVGGFETLRTGDIGKGFMAGLGAYGGAGLVAGVAGAGAASLGRDAIASTTENVARQGLEGAARDAAMQQGVASQLAAQTPFDQISAGFGAVTKDASSMLDFAKSNKNILSSLALPMLAGQAVKDQGPQTVTQPGMIRPYEYNPYGGTFTAGTPYKAANGGLMQLDKNSPRMANGGSVSFAAGGQTVEDLYQSVLGRGSDAGGLAYWQQKFGNEISSEEAAQFRAGAVPELAIKNAYQEQFGRPVEQAGYDYWTQQGAGNANYDYGASIKAGAQGQDIRARDDTTREGMTFGNASLTDPNLRYDADNNTWGTTIVDKPTNIATVDKTVLPAGVGGAGITTINPNGTITTRPNIPGIPEGGFTGMEDVRNAYTAGGGSLGYTPYVPKSMADFNDRYNTLSGGSKAAYDYLRGGAYDPKPSTPTGEIMKPYWESVAGFPVDESTKQFIFKNGKYERNVNYVPPLYLRNNPDKPPTSATPPGTSWVLDSNKIWQVAEAKPTTDPGLGKEWTLNDMQKWVATDIKASKTGTTTNIGYDSGQGGFGGDSGSNAAAGGGGTAGGGYGGTAGSGDAGTTGADGGLGDVGGGYGGTAGSGDAATGDFANGGILQAYKRMAAGGMSSLGSYSDGGRLLRGPGDGVSDNIPAVIGDRQPARLADGEFVVPARIVSEIGNGSTEAGARQLYKMMDRIQKTRGKTVGKNQVAVDSKARNLLPA